MGLKGACGILRVPFCFPCCSLLTCSRHGWGGGLKAWDGDQQRYPRRKDVAIELAWNLITREFAGPAERLTVTVYAGDDEAFELSRKITGLPESRILRIDGADNFWSMGNTGPCGPCAEIFYDHGEDIPGGPPGSPDSEGDRFVEIWNLVFMQYDRLSADERVDLPRHGAGTHRRGAAGG